MLYEKALIEGLLGKELNLLREIFSTFDFSFCFSENFLISLTKIIPFELIFNLSKLNLTFLPKFTLKFRDILSKKKLNEKELLKIVCKSNLSLIYILELCSKHYNYNVSLPILIKAHKNKVAQILINTSPDGSIKFGKLQIGRAHV